MPPTVEIDHALLPSQTLMGRWSNLGQGCLDDITTVVELRPDGPVFGTVIESSADRQRPRPYSLESNMTRAPGGFDVQYRDADDRRLRYRRADDKFVTRDPMAGLPTCYTYDNVVESLPR